MILIGPDVNRLPNGKSAGFSNEAAGYYISPENRARIVKSGGGGGDSIKYAPYKDLEPALFRVLSNRFAQVYSLKTPASRAFVQKKGIDFIFTPQFSTTSTSNSLVTWPPTEFTLTIHIDAVDREMQPVWHAEVTGVGHATFSEFKHDFALAAERAAEDAFTKLQAKLEEFPAK